MGSIGLGYEERKQGGESVLDRSDEAEIDFGASADLVAADVDLDNLCVSGEELIVGKVGAEHEENVAVLHGVVAGAESDQAGESYVVGVVVLDKFFAAEGVDDGGFQGFCGCHQLGV